MGNVTKWECWEDARMRIDAKKANEEKESEWNQQYTDSQDETSADTLTDCGGIQMLCGGIKPLAILHQAEGEE